MAAELLDAYEPEIETLTLIPSEGGCFEVDVNGNLIFSKIKGGRHAQPGEVVALIEKLLH